METPQSLKSQSEAVEYEPGNVAASNPNSMDLMLCPHPTPLPPPSLFTCESPQSLFPLHDPVCQLDLDYDLGNHPEECVGGEATKEHMEEAA